MDLEITVDQLKAHLASEHPPLLLDVREPWEYATAHIEGSTLIPMSEITGRAHQELDEDALVSWLREQGFDKAQSVAGGIDAWSRTIDPTIPHY